MLYSQLFQTLYGRAEKICPTKYMVLDKDGQPVLSMINSLSDAEHLVKLYQDSEVTERNENGKT